MKRGATSRSALACEYPRAISGNDALAIAVLPDIIAFDCRIQDARCRRRLDVVFSPSRRIWPEDTSRKPPAKSRIVDFPEPDGPTRAVRLPGTSVAESEDTIEVDE